MSTESEFPGFGKRWRAAHMKLRDELPPILAECAAELAAIVSCETLWHESALRDREGGLLETVNRAAGSRIFSDLRLASATRDGDISEIFLFDAEEIVFGPPQWSIRPAGHVVLLLRSAIGWTTAEHAQRWVEMGAAYRSEIVKACETV